MTVPNIWGSQVRILLYVTHLAPRILMPPPQTEFISRSVTQKCLQTLPPPRLLQILSIYIVCHWSLLGHTVGHLVKALATSRKVAGLIPDGVI
jgi:hypothetical protein